MGNRHSQEKEEKGSITENRRRVMEEQRNSLELWNRICEEYDYICRMKRRIPGPQWKEKYFLDLVNCVEHECKEQKSSALIEYIQGDLYRKKMPYSYIMILRAVWSFRKQPVELREIQYFIERDYWCDSNEVEELKKLLVNLPLKYSNSQLEQKKAEIEDLQRKASDIEMEISVSRKRKQEALDDEIRRERERCQQELSEELARERAVLLAQVKQEIQALKQEELHRIKAGAAYQLRQEENERYLQKVQEDIRRRTEFEDRLCDDIRDVSRSFKSSAGEMVAELETSTRELLKKLTDNIEKTQQELRRSAANAANAVVDTERKIRRDDSEALLWNFCELQEQLFYNVPEEELGLKTTQIEKYLKRFLKVLNRMGYEHYIPELGAVFDDEIHEEGEAADFGTETAAEKAEDVVLAQNSGETSESQPSEADEMTVLYSRGSSVFPETECVSGVIHYGFKKDNEICIKAKVTVK